MLNSQRYHTSLYGINKFGELIFDSTRDLRTHLSARNTRSVERLNLTSLWYRSMFSMIEDRAPRGRAGHTGDTLTWLHELLACDWRSARLERISLIPAARSFRAEEDSSINFQRYWTEEVECGRRVLTEFAPAADDRAVGEPRIDCEEPR